MTIRYTDSDVRTMLQIATRTLPELDALASRIKEDSWELESIAHGTAAITGRVLAYFELEREGEAFVWRVA